MRAFTAIAALCVALPTAVAATERPTPAELLAGAIARHDPEGAWETGTYRMAIRESRPDGTGRDTTVTIDNRAGTFQLASLREGDMLVGEVGPGECVWTVNGTTDVSDEVRDFHRLTCERLERMRNYYLFLWGLPMKLRDPGTRLGEEVVAAEFEGRAALGLRATYDEGVGEDVWYVYFDPESHVMIGYRFYHDEAANDGEYITLRGVQEGAGLALPRTRAWYTHQDDKYLGTDTLMSIERP